MSFRLTSLLAAAVAGLALWASVAAPAHAWRSPADYMRNWNRNDDGKDPKSVHAETLEHYAQAVEAIEKEEAAAEETLAKGEAEASQKAADDPTQAQRAAATAVLKAIAALEGCGAKYAKVQAAADSLGAKPGLTEQDKTQLATLLAKLKMVRRHNVERTAELYEKAGKDRKALSLYEALYNSIPESERLSAVTLKGKIEALREKLGLNRKADAPR